MNKKDFLKLHNQDDNSVIIVPVNEIEVIDTMYQDSDRKRYSKIYLKNSDIDSFIVNETPEKIYSMITD